MRLVSLDQLTYSQQHMPPSAAETTLSLDTRSARRWAAVAASIALLIGVFFLVLWLSDVPGAMALASERLKTNASFALCLLSLAVLLQLFRRQPVLVALAAGGAAALGALTLLQYSTGLSLGIDQLLARDLPNAEGAGFPNRMSPNAAVSIVLMGAATLLLRPGTRKCTLWAQALALLVLTISALTLVGYLYNAVFFYQPTRYLRMSPYTAVAQSLLGLAVLLSDTSIGFVRAAASPSLGGYLARRLLPLTMAVPLVIGWILLDASQSGALTVGEAHALHAVAVVMVLAGMVLFLSRSLDVMEQNRDRAQLHLLQSSRLTGALARARTVSEVIDASMNLGLEALGAQAGAFLMLSADGKQLLRVAQGGKRGELSEGLEITELDSEVPAAEAARTREAVFVSSMNERTVRYPRLSAQSAHAAWAALPLEGTRGLLGVLALSFTPQQSFEPATRERLSHLAWQCAQALDRALLFDSEQSARKDAEAASSAKDEFLAMLGHELRNPLSPILTSLHLMELRGKDTFERERAVIKRQVQHMTRLVDDLLDVSRITRGRIELRKRRVELSEIVGAALEQASPLIEQRRHRVHVNVPPGLTVEADPQRLNQVVSNLLTNAAKYTEPGGEIRVRAELVSGKVVLSVSDNGMGIAPELLPRIFTLFVQGKRTLDRSEGGLGLGLSLVKSLVELHGGSVQAKSEGAGRGTEMVVSLPAAPSVPPPATSAPEAAAGPSPGPKRILVVDDNRDAADSVAEALLMAGHEVEVAYDGPAALATASEFRPEVVFLDIGLPVMDGYEVARRFRDSALEPRPLLVAVTGYGQLADRERSADAGFDRHLVKPVSVELALEIVRAAEQGIA